MKIFQKILNTLRTLIFIIAFYGFSIVGFLIFTFFICFYFNFISEIFVDIIKKPGFLNIWLTILLTVCGIFTLFIFTLLFHSIEIFSLKEFEVNINKITSKIISYTNNIAIYISSYIYMINFGHTKGFLIPNGSKVENIVFVIIFQILYFLIINKTGKITNQSIKTS